MKLPFGKYKNISIEFVNSGYLKWLLTQDWFLEKEKECLAVEKELKIRDMNNDHFYEDKMKI